MRSLILAFGACLALTACQPTNNVNDVGNTNVSDHVAAANSGCGLTSNTLADEQALFAAETAYNIPADAYVKLAPNFPAEKRAAARKYLIQAYNTLKLARAAYKAGDECGLQSYVDLVKSLGNEAKALLPSN